VTTILNTAPISSSHDLASELYMNCDMLCANEVEAEQLTGLSVKSVEEAQAALWVLLDRGCSTAIITLGPMGAVFVTRAERVTHHVPTTPVTTVVDTTVCYISYHLYINTWAHK